MSAELAASTVTPGNTAPDVSFTVPVIDACARAPTGISASAETSAANLHANRMERESRRARLQRMSTPLWIQSGFGIRDSGFASETRFFRIPSPKSRKEARGRILHGFG